MTDYIPEIKVEPAKVDLREVEKLKEKFTKVFEEKQKQQEKKIKKLPACNFPECNMTEFVSNTVENVTKVLQCIHNHSKRVEAFTGVLKKTSLKLVENPQNTYVVKFAFSKNAGLKQTSRSELQHECIRGNFAKFSE